MNLRSIRRTATLITVLCVLPATALATAQEPDVLIYKGKTHALFANPLEDFYKDRKNRPLFVVEPNVISSGNWRGYVATWTIENNLLYLVKIDAWICNRDCTRVDLRRLFGTRYRNGKIKADWFSGDLRAPDGKMLQYVHMGYASIYERELILSVDSGKLVKESVVDNTKRTFPSALELQRQELERMRPRNDDKNSSAASKPSENNSDAPIVAGKGWGKVCLGVDLNTVESVLGKGEGRSTYSDVYFKDYLAKGIQISYNNSDNTIHAIFFYNGQRRYESFVTPGVKTDKGINWKSSPEDVIKAYGKPKEDHQGEDWRRIVFEGIDFRFENGVMVRIGIPGN